MQLTPGSEFWDSQHTRDTLQFGKYFGAGDEQSPLDDCSTWPETLRAWADESHTMSALGGLVSYLGTLKMDHELVSQRQFVAYDPLRHGTSMHMDGQTLQNLEIISNNADMGAAGTLLSLLCHCKTAMGKRLFRQWLCHPLRHAGDIEDRYDAIGDLHAHDMMPELAKELTRMPDLERLVSRIHAGTCALPDFLAVLRTFQGVAAAIARMQDVAAQCKSRTLRRVLTVAPDGDGDGDGFPDLAEPLEHFAHAFDHDVAAQEGHIVPHAGVDADYDAAKARLDALEKGFDQHLREMRATLRDAKIAYRDIGSERYQLEISAGTKVPADFILKSQTKAVRRYWTPYIARSVVALAEAQAAYTQAQAQVYGHTLERFVQWHGQWARAVQCVATLDCLMSLATAAHAMGEPVCRPTLVAPDTATGSPVLDLHDMRHPCVASQYVMLMCGKLVHMHTQEGTGGGSLQTVWLHARCAG
jgi:DNA mismatch repair protein MSH6